MSEVLLVLYLCAGLLLVYTFWAAARPIRPPTVFTYPGGVELAGNGRPGRLRFDIVKWLREPDNSSICPLVVHLPEGDLGGTELCCWNSPVEALKLGAHADVDIVPIFGPMGSIEDVIGVRVGLIPVGRPIEISIKGVRVRLPLSEQDALKLLGEPTGRTVLRP